jgi:hypothetical protein
MKDNEVSGARERGKTCTGFSWEIPKERDHLKEYGTYGRMGSKRNLGGLIWGWGGGGVDSSSAGKGPLAGRCECGDEPSDSGATELVMDTYMAPWYSAYETFHFIVHPLYMLPNAIQ